MLYLMVLLLTFGLLVLMLGVVCGISYALGRFLRTRGEPSNPPNSDPCAQFSADQEWYEGLPMLERNVVMVWWLVNRYQSAARGCG
jgi:hypothetical protein